MMVGASKVDERRVLLIEPEIIELSEEYAVLSCGMGQTHKMILKIIEAYADEIKNDLDELVLEEWDYNNYSNDLVNKVGDPQEWKHKQKKRPWN